VNQIGNQTVNQTVNQIAVVARLQANEGQRDALAAALQAALNTAAAEPGTVYYILHEDSTDADGLWMYEMYADQAALEAHSSSGGYKALGPAIRPFLAARPELTFLKPIGGKGV
jgi:quinol monooxygenase YgiN